MLAEFVIMMYFIFLSAGSDISNGWKLDSTSHAFKFSSFIISEFVTMIFFNFTYSQF